MTTEAQNQRLAARMRKWSDAKLDKEFAFALLASDAEDPNNVAWVAAVKAEAIRRRVPVAA